MADQKISALTGASTPLAGTEVLPIVQSGSTVKATVENVFNATQPSGTALGVVTLDTNKRPITSLAFKWTGSSLGLNIGSNAPGYTNDVVGTYRYQDTFGQNGYELTPGTTNIATSYNRTTATWLPLRQRALTHEFFCDGSLAATFTQTGNLAFVNGKGIDFSATPGTGTSELLADYEEGAWTPNQGAALVVVGAYSSSGTYTKVGRLVTVTAIQQGATSISTGSSNILFSNLPFNVGAFSRFSGVTSMQFSAVAGAVAVGGTGNVYSAGGLSGGDTIITSLSYEV